MKRYHWVRLYLLLLMITLFSLSMFVVSAGAFFAYKRSASQRSIVRSVQDISDASSKIMEELSEVAAKAGEEQYADLSSLAGDGDTTLSERELEQYFRKGCANKIRKAIGRDSSAICATLSSYIPAGDTSVVTDPATVLEEETDDDGNLIGLRIKNVTIECTHRPGGTRRDTVSYRINFPDVVFHAGNDELFRYCMVAGKGIYITGKTSSIIGDIYAGTHSDQEQRDAEIGYGETGTYGGINILTTQLGVRSERIVSEGDININGSFVIFSPADDTLRCYAQRINEMRGFSKNTMYSLEGQFVPTHRMEEADLTEFNEAVTLVGNSLSGLGGISIYYDSNNDPIYIGRYRKLISETDVDIKDDFTGIVVTPGNVIIHNDVNFEGTILCGDRIYIMGNNNIVSNAGVIRSIVGSDFKDENVVKASDFIPGLKGAGYTDPDYYVIPYR